MSPNSGAYVRDEATMRLSPSIAPGTYRLAIEVYDCVVLCDLAARRQFVGANGELIGMTLPLTATVLVEGA